MFFSFVTFSQIVWSGEWVFGFKDSKQVDPWKITNGTWKIQKGFYPGVSAVEKMAHILFDETDWADYTAEAKIRVEDPNYPYAPVNSKTPSRASEDARISPADCRSHIRGKHLHWLGHRASIASPILLPPR